MNRCRLRCRFPEEMCQDKSQLKTSSTKNIGHVITDSLARSALLERSFLHTISLSTSQPGEKPKDGEWSFSWRSVNSKFHAASENFTLQVKSTKRTKRNESNLMGVDLLGTSKTLIGRNFLRHISLNDATMSKERETSYTRFV